MDDLDDPDDPRGSDKRVQLDAPARPGHDLRRGTSFCYNGYLEPLGLGGAVPQLKWRGGRVRNKRAARKDLEEARAAGRKLDGMETRYGRSSDMPVCQDRREANRVGLCRYMKKSKR